MAADLSTGAYQNLGNFGDFDHSVVLAMAADLADALLSLEANGSYFVSLGVFFDYLGSDLSLLDYRSANTDVVTVNDE